MTWLKVSDRALADPRFLAVSRDARLMHVEAISASMAYEGDGAVNAATLRRWTDAEDPDVLAAELVAAGLWERTSTGWQIAYMLDDQPTPAEIARQREFNRTRQARYRRHRQGDHVTCDPAWCRGARNAVTDSVTEREGTPSGGKRDTVDNGTPSRPVPKGKGKGKAASSASPSANASGSSPLAGRRRGPMSPARRKQIGDSVRRAHAERRARREDEREAKRVTEAEAAERRAAEQRARDEEIAERRAEEQRRRDQEWLDLGGSPDDLPVSADRLFRKKYPGRRQLR